MFKDISTIFPDWSLSAPISEPCREFFDLGKTRSHLAAPSTILISAGVRA